MTEISREIEERPERCAEPIAARRRECSCSVRTIRISALIGVSACTWPAPSSKAGSGPPARPGDEITGDEITGASRHRGRGRTRGGGNHGRNASG